MEPTTQTYPQNSIGSHMSTHVPTCTRHSTKQELIALLSKNHWQSTRNIYVLDGSKLLGYIDAGDLLHAAPSARAETLMRSPTQTLRPHTDQEKAIFIAIKDDVVTVPVVDKNNDFLGVITAHSIIDIMHAERMEDALLSAGIRGRGVDIIRLATERAGIVFRTRAPWLILGLVFGLSLGFIATFFEETLNKSIALAYFIPVVAYIAGSVGTQTGTIAVRALSNLKLSYPRYAAKEGFTGMLLGALLGTLGGLGALLITRVPEVAITVGIALLAASTCASLLSSFVPFMLERLGKDPALGSGPLANALQDIVSVLIYFFVAIAIVSP